MKSGKRNLVNILGLAMGLVVGVWYVETRSPKETSTKPIAARESKPTLNQTEKTTPPRSAQQDSVTGIQDTARVPVEEESNNSPEAAPELPADLKAQLEAPPPELPEDLKAQLQNPPPELPEDIKRAMSQPPRSVTIEEVNTPSSQ